MRKKQKVTPKKREKSTFLPRARAAVAPRMTLECAERYEMLVCGCKKIEAYSPEETVLATSACRVRVKGAKLRLAFTGDGKIMLSGTISAIEFE